MMTIGSYAQVACIWEVSARKVGNVHRFAEFPGLSYLDFIYSALAIAPVMERASQQTIGQTVLQSIQATREVVSTNTNLGIVLLLAPLASIPLSSDLTAWRLSIPDTLNHLTVADAEAVYTAIRLAHPGGLGKVEQQDVADAPTLTLKEVMQLAAHRDQIAKQYTNDFQDLFHIGLPALLEGWQRFGCVEGAILSCQLAWLAEQPDSLIVRKQGLAEAQQVQQWAKSILNLGLETPAGQAEWLRLDQWLRSQDNRRNPGTTADLVTACLFLALRECRMDVLAPFPWNAALGSSS